MINDYIIISGAQATGKTRKAKEFCGHLTTIDKILKAGFKLFFDNQCVIIDEVTKDNFWIVDKLLSIDKLKCKLVIVTQEDAKKCPKHSRAKIIICNSHAKKK